MEAQMFAKVSLTLKLAQIIENCDQTQVLPDIAFLTATTDMFGGSSQFFHRPSLQTRSSECP